MATQIHKTALFEKPKDQTKKAYEEDHSIWIIKTIPRNLLGVKTNKKMATLEHDIEKIRLLSK